MKIFKLKADGTVDIEVNCLTDGIEACILNSADIVQNDTIRINVTCTEICKYDIFAYWSGSTPLVPDRPLILNFEESAYAKLFVVDFSKEDFKQAQVILQA